MFFLFCALIHLTLSIICITLFIALLNRRRRKIVGKRKRRNQHIGINFYSRVTQQNEGKSGSFSDLIGKAREKIIEASLWYLTNSDPCVLSYSMTTHFTRPDINGIDAFVVCLPKGASKRIVVPISVTGFLYVRDHLKKHPQIPVISISMESHDLDHLKRIVGEHNPSVVASLISTRFLRRVSGVVKESIDFYIKKNI